jgi:hypothetical protein
VYRLRRSEGLGAFLAQEEGDQGVKIEALAENWAHDNMDEAEYEDEDRRNLIVAAYVAGFMAALQ